MLAILNIVLLLLLIGMVFLWSTYGFFSALLHLIIVIASGVIALALWEPLSYWLLGRMPLYAHGVGLLAPFALLLILLRVVFDKLIRSNLTLHRLADQIGGGVCGLLSGILAFGLLLVGVNFMHVPKAPMGWAPYAMVGNDYEPNADGGGLWLPIDKWSAGFFQALSRGSMSPMSGPSLAEARPGLAKRAVIYRMPLDENQMRSAHPDSVEVAGVYSMPATRNSIRGVIDRSIIFAFLKPSYKLPEGTDYGDAGTGIIDAALRDLRDRHNSPGTYGKPSDLLDIEAVQSAARTAEMSFNDPLAQENFEPFLRRAGQKMGAELSKRLEPVLADDKTIFVVDLKWNNKHPGVYNPEDNKLRVAVSQVRLQVKTAEGLEEFAPIGFSIETNQNNGARVFTETVNDQPTAYSPYPEFKQAWAFAIPKDLNAQKGEGPVRMFVREMRFDLTKLKGSDQASPVIENSGALAHVLGSPKLPKPLAKTAGGGEATQIKGSRIAASGTYAEVNEELPTPLAASAASVKVNESSDPWKLVSGKMTNGSPGKGGKTSSVREIFVEDADRIVRVKVELAEYSSIYGRAIGLAERLNTIQLMDEGGNRFDSIGYILYKVNSRAMDFDIREDVAQGGVSAAELPRIRSGEELYLYFQVPVGSRVVAYMLGSEEQRFDKPLVIRSKQ